jgi:hypothetical protein
VLSVTAASGDQAIALVIWVNRDSLAALAWLCWFFWKHRQDD